MKKLFTTLLVICFILSLTSENIAQKKSSSFHFKSKSYNTFKIPKSTYKSNTYKAPKIKSYTPKSYSLPKSTYKSGTTTYIVGDNYKTTGMPKVKRSESAKDKFLKHSWRKC